MKLRFAEKLAIFLTVIVVAFCSGYYLRGTALGDAIVIETEKTVPVTAEAVSQTAPVSASAIPTTSQAPGPSATAPALSPSAEAEAPASPEEVALSAGEEPLQEQQDDRLDLNTATLEELDTLPGIGPVLGQRILDYREEFGGFQTVEELLYVKGIGEKTLEKLENLVKVGE